MTLLQTRYRAGLLTSLDELALWRTNLGTLFDIHVDQPDAFRMSIDAYHLGALLLGPIHTVQQHYQRSRRLVATHGIDHYLVQQYRTGGFVGENGPRALTIRPGDLSVLDLSQTVESHANTANLFNILIPRPVLDAALRHGADVSGLVLPGDSALGGLLRDYLAALEQRLPSLTERETAAAVDATVAILAACLQPSAASFERAQPALADVKLRRVKAFIAQHLASPELTPDALADRFHLSRAALYRMFAARGGVARAIRMMRLERCMRTLADPTQHHRSAQAIAEEHGIACPAHFSRLFRKTFGVTPSEVRRSAGLPPSSSGPAQAAPLDGWIRSLGASR